MRSGWPATPACRRPAGATIAIRARGGANPNPFGGLGGRGLGGNSGRAQLQGPDEGLPKIAAATGGGYFELTSPRELASTFARVADELHHQYSLGFTPEKLDGKMHDLVVHGVEAGVRRARPFALTSRRNRSGRRKAATRHR